MQSYLELENSSSRQYPDSYESVFVWRVN